MTVHCAGTSSLVKCPECGGRLEWIPSWGGVGYAACASTGCHFCYQPSIASLIKAAMDELETTGLSQSDLQPIPESPKNLTRIRLDLFHAAYTLAFGTRSQEADALETISHLLFVLTHQNMKEEKQ